MDSTSYSLWQKVVHTTEQALQRGALQPISTHIQIVPDQRLQFCVRVIDSLARKKAAQKPPSSKSSTQAHNPFLPYEEALFVENLSETHACLLNKFNVVNHHILMVTREYESQDTWLTYADFEALVRCLIEIDGLGFYNGGTQAGASQHHKHLQLIPLSSEQGELGLPLAVFIDAQKDALTQSSSLKSLPFRHCVRLLTVPWTQNTCAETARCLLTTYEQLMVDLGLALDSQKPEVPYNLLVTRQWLMVIPRSQESYQDIGVNSLGYSGWLLVKTMEELERLRQIGPMTLLQKVGQPQSNPI